MIVMAGSSTTASREINDGLSNRDNHHQQPLLSLISNIMLEGAGAAVDNTLSCTLAGAACSSNSECFPHNACRFLYNKCEWCPGAGDSCGLTWQCCPGLSCSSRISGTCS
uniref:Uncharacterized protein n=1 Tax=Chenopodium quinoa TaxID=63459 RepID=A0A803KQ94_CHEQI